MQKYILPTILLLLGLVLALTASVHSPFTVFNNFFSLGFIGSGIVLIIANLKYKLPPKPQPSQPKMIWPILLILLGLWFSLGISVNAPTSPILIAFSLGFIGSGIVLLIANLKYKLPPTPR